MKYILITIILIGYTFAANDQACATGADAHCTTNTCTATTTKDCNSCVNGFTLKNAYADNTDSVCTACTPGCKTCTATKPTECLTCYDGWIHESSSKTCKMAAGCAFTYAAGKCTGCMSGFYLKSDETCPACATGCLTCAAADTCLTFASGYRKATGDKPEKCDDTNCTKCDADKTKCETCMGGWKLDATTSKCVELKKTEAECTVAFKTIFSVALVALVAFFKF